MSVRSLETNFSLIPVTEKLKILRAKSALYGLFGFLQDPANLRENQYSAVYLVELARNFLWILDDEGDKAIHFIQQLPLPIRQKTRNLIQKSGLVENDSLCPTGNRQVLLLSIFQKSGDPDIPNNPIVILDDHGQRIPEVPQYLKEPAEKGVISHVPHVLDIINHPVAEPLDVQASVQNPEIPTIPESNQRYIDELLRTNEVLRPQVFNNLQSEVNGKSPLVSGGKRE